MRAEPEGDELSTTRAGSSRINVYRSQYAETDHGVGVDVDDVEGKVRALKATGVSVERYDMFDARRRRHKNRAVQRVRKRPFDFDNR